MPEPTQNGDHRTCGQCRHWVRVPQDPMNLDPKAVRGACTNGPPQMSFVPMQGPRGQVVMQELCGYPKLPPEFQACSQFQSVTLAIKTE